MFKKRHAFLTISVLIISTMLFTISGCAPGSSIPTSETAEDNIPSAQSRGKTVTFEYNKYFTNDRPAFSVEVSCVASEKTGIANDGNPWEYTIYELYPGARLTVINADMVDGSLTESGEPHAQWRITDGTGDYENDIPITDELQPIEITEDMKGIIGEGMYVLGFEWNKS